VPVGSTVNVYGQDATATRRVEEELRRTNRAKDEFLGVLSHELRNPLAPILNSLYILQQAEPGGAQALRALGVVDRQTKHLARLVDDLLDVSRIARGKIELQVAELDLCAVARQTAEDYSGVMKERGLRFTLDVPSGPVWMRGDGTRLAQVIGNLLQNAAKFTPEGGIVALAVANVDAAVELRVRDSGVGMAPELLKTIFQPFAQAKQGLARSGGGLGLGLALVKGIAELHGGSVRADSAGEGRGAEFVVRFPVAEGGRVNRSSTGPR
jgi:signal transduction histidine kinase